MLIGKKSSLPFFFSTENLLIKTFYGGNELLRPFFWQILSFLYRHLILSLLPSYLLTFIFFFLLLLIFFFFFFWVSISSLMYLTYTWEFKINTWGKILIYQPNKQISLILDDWYPGWIEGIPLEPHTLFNRTFVSFQCFLHF